MQHSMSLTHAAAALLASGATFHVKDAGDPIETLKKAFGDHNTEVLKKLGATDEFLKGLSARMLELEQKSVRRENFGTPFIDTWGSQVANNPDVAGLNSNWKGRCRIDVKAATITSATTDADGSAGALINPDRRAGVIELPRRKLRLRQLFAPGQTASNSIQWPKMKERNLNAATVAETALKPQSDLQFELKTWPVVTIAHWMIASRQVLDDVPALSSIIDSELRFGLADVEDYQFLHGAGGADLVGVYPNATAFVAPFEPAGTTVPTFIDVLLLAIAQCDALNFETDGIVLNPLDWRFIQSIKDEVGRYIGGGPFGDLLARLWQMPIATSTAMVQGNFMVGAFRQGAQIFDRQEATVELSTEDSDNFRKNLVTILGEERLAFVVKHPTAFVKGNFADALATIGG